MSQTNNYEDLIREGEADREQGRLEAALVKFDAALVVAGKESNMTALLEAWAHRLEVWKFYFNQTQQPVFWEMVRADAEAGVSMAEAVKITGHPKAVMLLRRGTFDVWKKDWLEASKWFRSAYDELPEKENSLTRAEFLGHLGEAVGMTNEIEGLSILQKSLSEAQGAADETVFHQLVVVSGILLRTVRVLLQHKKTDEAKRCLEQATELSRRLHEEFAMSARLEQCTALAKINV